MISLRLVPRLMKFGNANIPTTSSPTSSTATSTTRTSRIVCTFCAFYRRGRTDAYVRTVDEICAKIDDNRFGWYGRPDAGWTPSRFRNQWYEDLLRTLHAKYPNFQLHCFSPPEIHNIHLISGLDYETIMGRLKDAGLYSLPGGGGGFWTTKCAIASPQSAQLMNGSE